MVLKRVWDEVIRLENAIKKRSIRISAKTTYWPFRDIAELGEWCLINAMKSLPLSIFCIAISSCSLFSDTVQWATWSSPSSFNNSSYGNAYATTTTGLIAAPSGQSVVVSLNGEILQTGSYFNTSLPGFTYGGTYATPEQTWTSTRVSNLPGNSDQICLTGGAVSIQTLTFDKAVKDIFLDIGSLGSWSGPVSPTWTFNQSFVLLSQDSDFNRTAHNNPFSISGNSLTGTESSGTILFSGTFTSLSWTVTGATSTEYANYTVGVSTVPEPSALSLLAVGLGGLAILHLRRS